MKKLLLILLCLPMIGFGQVTSPSVVSGSGDTYSIGKVKPYEEIEEIEHREIKITFVDTDGKEM